MTIDYAKLPGFEIFTPEEIEEFTNATFDNSTDWSDEKMKRFDLFCDLSYESEEFEV